MMRRCCVALALGWLAGPAWNAAAQSKPPEYATYGTQRQVDKPAAVGDPVSAASGASSWRKTLVPLGGPMDLDFSIHYRTDPNATYLRSPGDFPPGFYFDNSGPFLNAWTWQPAPLLLGNSWYDMTLLLEDGGQVCFATNGVGEFVFTAILGISGGVDRNYQLKKMDNWFYFCDPTRGRVTMFQLPDGTGTRFHRPETVTDRNGNRLTYTYLTKFECNPRSIADDAGRALYFRYEYYQNEYIWEPRFAAVTDHVGRAWTFLYDENASDNGGRITLRGVVEPGSRTNTFLYRPNNFNYSVDNLARHLSLMVSVVDPLGHAAFSNEYAVSSLGAAYPHVRCVAQTDACGNRTTLAMTTELGRCIGDVTNPDGSTNRFVHDSHHDLPPYRITDGAGQTMVFERNIAGHFRSAKDRAGATTRFAYDPACRRLTSVTNALGEATVIVWETVEQSFTNPATNHTVSFSFDQIVRIEHPDGTSEQFAYDGQGNVTARTDRAGAVWRTVRDARGRPVQSLRPGGGAVTRTYAANGLLLAVTDSDGFAETYGYDPLFRLASVTNAVGGVRRYVYDEAGRLARITDELGQETTLTYDANGNPTSVVDPAGYVLSREYDVMGRLARVLDAAGMLETRTYDEMGRLAMSATQAATNVFGYHANGWPTNAATGVRAWTWRHDADGRITNAVAPDSGVMTIARDALGRPVAVADPLGKATVIAYDADGRIAAVTNPQGAKTCYAYDGAGRPRAVTNALGDVATREYDADGNLVAATDPDGHATRWSYTPMGRLEAVTNALGETRRFAYDAVGRLAAVTHADGTATTYEYDAAGRMAALADEATNVWRFARDARGAVVAVTNPAGGATAWTYNPDGTLRTVTDGETGLASNRYDAARRLVETTLPGGSSAQWSYNEHGETTAFTDPSGATTRYAYDAAGRLAAVTDALGQAAAFTYDRAGRLTNAVDRTGAGTRYAYDAVGHLVAATDATGVCRAWTRDLLGRATNITVGTSTWTFAYNAVGAATQIVAPSGRATIHLRDALGRIAQTVDPLGRTNAVAHDPRGRIAATTDPAGRDTHYAYDPCGRLAGTTLPDDSGFACRYDALGNLDRLTDANGNAWNFAWSHMGRLLGHTDPLGRATTYTNDARGDLSGIAFPTGDRLDLERDANGRIVRANHSAGPDLTFHRDALGRLTNAPGFALAYDAEGRITAAESDGVAFGATYDAAGRLATATYADGALAVTYTYAVGPDGDGRLTRASDSLTGTQIDFAYDADGRLATVSLPNGETIVHTWDDADRLTRLQSGDHVDAQLTYDLAGQVAQTVLTAPLPATGGLGTATQALTVDAAAQIASAGFAHDGRGRVTQIPAPWHAGGAALAWDGASRLVGCNDAGYTYDGLGNLQTRTEGGVIHRFFHHPAIGGAPLVAERAAATGAFQRYYVWTPGGRLLYLIDAANGNAVRFHHFDPGGNTLALTDMNRAVTDAWAYDPYGRILARTGSSPQPFTFCGAWGVRQDGADGLYQMRARWYHARLARFLSPEPIWPQLGEPKALNPYQYAGADPIRFADPSGRSLFNNLTIYDQSVWDWAEAGYWEDVERMFPPAAIPASPELRRDLHQWRVDLGRFELGHERPGPDASVKLAKILIAWGMGQMKIRADFWGWNVWGKDAPFFTAYDLARGIPPDKWQAPPKPPAENPRLSTVSDVVAKNLAHQFRPLQNQQQSAAWFAPPPDPAPENYQGDNGPPPAADPPRYTLPDSVFKAPPRRPIRDPLEFILDKLFGPQAILDYAAQQRAQEETERNAAVQPPPALPPLLSPMQELNNRLDAALRQAASRTQAGDFEGAREALQDARNLEKERDQELFRRIRTLGGR